MCLFESWAWQRQCSHCERTNDLTGGRSNHSHFNSRKHTHTHTHNFQPPAPFILGLTPVPMATLSMGEQPGSASHSLPPPLHPHRTGPDIWSCLAVYLFIPQQFFSWLYIFTFYRFLSLCLASDHAHAKRQRTHTHTHTYEVHSMALSKYESIKTFLGLYFSSMHQAVFCILHKNTTSVLFITAITMS